MKYNIVRKVKSYSCVIKYKDNWGVMKVNLHSSLNAELNVCQSLYASDVLLQGKEAKITSKFESGWVHSLIRSFGENKFILSLRDLKLAEGINHN